MPGDIPPEIEAADVLIRSLVEYSGGGSGAALDSDRITDAIGVIEHRMRTQVSMAVDALRALSDFSLIRHDERGGKIGEDFNRAVDIQIMLYRAKHEFPESPDLMLFVAVMTGLELPADVPDAMLDRLCLTLFAYGDFLLGRGVELADSVKLARSVRALSESARIRLERQGTVPLRHLLLLSLALSQTPPELFHDSAVDLALSWHEPYEYMPDLRLEDQVMLAQSLLRLGKIGGRAHLLDRGVAHAAPAARCADATLRSEALLVTGSARWARWKTDRTGDLDEIIGLLHAVVHPPELVRQAGVLRSHVYRARWDHAGHNSSDLMSAISEMESALAKSNRNDSKNAKQISDLGNMWTRLWETTGDESALAHSVRCYQEAAERADWDSRAGCLHNLACALVREYQRDHDPEVLKKAHAHARTAVDATPHGQSTRPEHLLTLATCEYLVAGGDPVLEAGALRAVAQAALMAGDSFVFTVAAHTFSSILNEFTYPRFREVSIEASRLSARSAAGAPRHRALSAIAWADSAAPAGAWEEAAEAAELALTLVDQSTTRGMLREQQEHVIDGFSRTATDAAAFAVASGDAQRALRLLEFGRCTLLGRLRAPELVELRQRHAVWHEQLIALGSQFAQQESAGETA